jgi:flavin reductase (DIM6/NTAB) family NADH-FMN oxidoreductase RutF
VNPNEAPDASAQPVVMPYVRDPRRIREAFSYFPSGVVALIADVDGEPQGMVASAFTVGVSIDPPLVSCAIQVTSSTWPRLKRASAVGISVLGEDQGPLARQLGSRDRANRFAGVTLQDNRSPARFVPGAPLWLECTVHAEFPAGDHTVVLFEVVGLSTETGYRPLVFHGSAFRQLLLRSGADSPDRR